MATTVNEAVPYLLNQGEGTPMSWFNATLTLKASAKKRVATFTGKVSPKHKRGTVVISRVVGKKLSRLGKAKLTKKSTFKLAKKLSIGALSQQFARRLMLQVIPWPAKSPW